jgi:CheY-like chemotaxis protein
MSAVKILVCDDDYGITENLKALLTARGYKALAVTDGAAAVALARKELPALVLLDIEMPRMGGFDVLRVLQTDPATTKIKVVMITGLSQMADVEKAFQNGAKDYIIKPFDAERIFKKIEKVLSGPA